MHRKSSIRYAIGRVHVVNAVSVNNVKRILEENLKRGITLNEILDPSRIGGQGWSHLELLGFSPRFEPIGASWSLPPEGLRQGHFIPLRMVSKPVTRKSRIPWFKVYRLIELSDLMLWARLWFYLTEFPHVSLGVDRMQENIFLHEPAYS